MSNHVDRFYAAVTAVAGHGNIKQRLISAYEEHLAIIDDQELPLSVREDFAGLRCSMTGVEPLNGEGRIRATVRKMSVFEADACAHKMVDIYARLLRLGRRAEADVPLNIGEPSAIPPFLVKSANS